MIKIRTALIVLAVPSLVVATATCYAPTEVTVVLSTDLDCVVDAPRTGIFKGNGSAKIEPNAETETSSCTKSDGESKIGTLVIVPSESKDGRATVQAILARNNKTPSDCKIDPKDCIIATRAFSFVAHESRRLPIRLLAECLGKVCADGQTCGVGGSCQSIDTSCSASGTCVSPADPPKPPADDGGPGLPTDDAGPFLDGGEGEGGVPLVDAGPRAPCTFPGGSNVLVGTTEAPMASAATASAIFYTDGKMIRRVSKLEGTSTAPIAVASGDAVQAIGTDGDAPLAALLRTGQSQVDIISAANTTKLPPGFQATSIFGALGGGQPRIFVSSIGKAYRVDPVGLGNVTELPVAGREVVATSTIVYLGTAVGISAVLRSNNLTQGMTGTSAPENSKFAITSDHSHVVAGGGSASGKIVDISTLDLDLITTRPKPPSAIALDDILTVYWAEGSEIRSRSTFTANEQSVITFKPGSAISFLAVDPGATNEGCLYYWLKEPDAPYLLSMFPKKPPSKDGGL